MSRKLVRNITDTKLTGKVKEPLDTNVQNDLLSDDSHAYIRNKDQYYCLTDNIKSVSSSNDLLEVVEDDSGNVEITAKPSEDIDLSDYATKTYVDTEISKLVIPDERIPPNWFTMNFLGYATLNVFERNITLNISKEGRLDPYHFISFYSFNIDGPGGIESITGTSGSDIYGLTIELDENKDIDMYKKLSVIVLGISYGSVHNNNPFYSKNITLPLLKND